MAPERGGDRQVRYCETPGGPHLGSIWINNEDLIKLTCDPIRLIQLRLYGSVRSCLPFTSNGDGLATTCPRVCLESSHTGIEFIYTRDPR